MHEEALPNDAPEGAARLASTVRSFGALAGATLLGQLLGFVALAYVARRAGPHDLGAYSFDLSLATYFGLAANLGAAYVATREIATDPQRAPQSTWETLVIQVSLSLVIYVVLLLVGPLLTTEPESRRLLPIVALTIPVTALTLDWALLASRRARTVGSWRLAGQVGYAALVFAFIHHRGVILAYSWFNVVGFAITMVGLLVAYRKVLGTPPKRIRPKALFLRLRQSAPFAYSSVMVQVYASMAIPLLGYLASTTAVGIYSVAFRLPYSLIGLAGVWLSIFFPHGSARFAASPEKFLEDIGRTLTATVIIASAVAVAAPLCARDLMPTVFGSGFSSAATPFALLSVSAALVLIQATTSNALVASGHEHAYARIITVVATVLVVGDLILIPTVGVVGAASMAIVAESMIVCLTVRKVRAAVGVFDLDWQRVGRGAAAVATMGVATAAARETQSAVIEVLAAVLTFVPAALLFRAFDPDLFRTESRY